MTFVVWGHLHGNEKIQIFSKLKPVFTLARHSADSRLSGSRVSDRVPE